MRGPIPLTSSRLTEVASSDLARTQLEIPHARDAVRTPSDDRTRNVFDPELRGHTDRFVLRLRRPADAATGGPG